MTLARPRTTAQALEALAADPDALVLGGGTDLMVEVNAGRGLPERVVALRRVAELGEVTATRDGHDLGAGLTWRAMERRLGGTHPALAAAARSVGSPQVRNAGTLGGNLGTASVTGSTLPVLLALDAEVVLGSAGGTRTVPIAAFLRGQGNVDRRPGELILAVRVPRVRGPQAFLKVGARASVITAVVQCALVLDLERREVRCGIGAVGPVPVRAAAAERFAAGAVDWDRLTAEPGAAARFGALAAEAVDPPADLHATAAYRRHAVGVLTRRALTRALAAA